MNCDQIDIRVIDYKGTKILSGTLPEVILLYPHYLEHKWKINLERDDEGVTKSRFFQGNEYIRKSAINCIAAFYNNDDEIFNVEVVIGSRSQNLSVVFSTMAEAVAFKNKLVTWLHE